MTSGGQALNFKLLLLELSKIVMSNQLYNLPYLKETRQYLRKNMTEAELVLWTVITRRIHKYFIPSIFMNSSG